MTSGSSSWLVARYRFVILLILFIAAALRLYGLVTLSPPGLEHDEVAHWLINRDILAGNHAVYFTEAYGHEAGFHYFQTGFMVLLGDNALALRLPAAFVGLLLVAVTFALTRRLFGLQTALLSAGLLAVLFWPVFYSRLALRAISLPLISSLSAYFWWRGWQMGSAQGAGREKPNPTSSWRVQPRWLILEKSSWRLYFIVAGILAGLSVYTYMAGRVVPVFYVLFAGYLLLFHRSAFRERQCGVLLFFLAFVLVAAPLAVYLLTNPGAEARISEVNRPLLSLIDGDLRAVSENVLKFLGMFGFRGDPLWRQNVALLPVFEPLIAVFFYIGLLISLWRWREPRYLFLMLWLLTAAIPSILTIDAPSSIRIINALPVLTVFPVIGLQVIHFFRPLSTVSTKLSPKIGGKALLILLSVFLVLYVGRTTRAVFQTWPANEEVGFVWQKALTEAAAYLDVSSESGPVAVGGWTPHTMDPPTMRLTLQRDDLNLRYFEPTQSLIIPTDSGQSSRVVLPTDLPLDSALESLLLTWGASSQEINSFTKYDLFDSPVLTPQFPAQVTFGNQLAYLGYDLPTQDQLGANTNGDHASLHLITYWQVQEPADGRRRLFLHLVDEDGNIVAQNDGLGAPAAHWRTGDIILQRLQLDLPTTAGPYSLRLGVYDPDSGRRLITNEGADYVPLTVRGIEQG